ncbi:cell division protein ZipA [Pasteurellaceae bacterium 20609_3]|uniref:cell division protein ZipA n=1 Tax=Spirabiliibacterium mucosae TaxID=28156 RepID=UPI001AACBAAB|nr:cell division protein ZipA [Spirabiliibacterium mucosae]MBE2897544.1 cell division protein ZipA [Spirabiliibacterium mucosae]
MDLHIILIVFIVLIVAVLLIHGLWSSRREKSQLFKSAKTFTYDSRVANNDILDIETPQASAASVPPAGATNAPAPEPAAREPMSVAEEVDNIRITLPGHNTNASSAPAEPKASLSRSSLLHKSVAEIEQQADREHGITITAPEDRAALAERAAQLPKIDELQPQESAVTIQEPPAPKAPENEIKAEAPKAEKKSAPSDTIIFYVVPKAGAFKGLEIVQSLESLGFSYGEGQLFHRHFQLQDTTSPILFSAAHMYKPGIFDMATIADATSQGLIVFMTLPTHGNNLANFRLLLHSVKTLSDDLNGEVLDVHRTPFNEQSKADYLAMLQ